MKRKAKPRKRTIPEDLDAMALKKLLPDGPAVTGPDTFQIPHTIHRPGCESCRSKDAEIAWLRSRVEKLEDVNSNLADPMVHARLKALENIPPAPGPVRADGSVGVDVNAPKERVSAPGNPYMKWRGREDRPEQTPTKRGKPETMEDVERRIRTGR